MNDDEKTATYRKYISKLTEACPSFAYLCILVNILLRQSPGWVEGEASQICSEPDLHLQHTIHPPEPLLGRLPGATTIFQEGIKIPFSTEGFPEEKFEDLLEGGQDIYTTLDEDT